MQCLVGGLEDAHLGNMMINRRMDNRTRKNPTPFLDQTSLFRVRIG